jgi:Na+/proline symporter
LKRICTIAWTLTGVAAIAYFANLGVTDIEPDNVFGEMARRFLPEIMPGLLGLFLAGLLATVMSSCDAFMIAVAGLFTENLYKPFVPNASRRHYLWVARLSSLAVVASGVWFAFGLESVPKGLEIFWKIPPMLGIAFWLGLFWRRMNAVGAWASTAVAVAAWWVTEQPRFVEWVGQLPASDELRFVFVADGQATIYLPWQMVFYLTAGSVAGVIASLLTPPVDEARLERYYALIRTPVVEGETVEQPCTLPDNAVTLPRRKLLPIPSLEIYVPSSRMATGFIVAWGGVALLMGVFVWLVR